MTNQITIVNPTLEEINSLINELKATDYQLLNVNTYSNIQIMHIAVNQDDNYGYFDRWFMIIENEKRQWKCLVDCSPESWCGGYGGSWIGNGWTWDQVNQHIG